MGFMARPVQWDNYRSKLCWVTISGYVMLRAMLHGTPSSSMAMLGSPDMTVRAEKSTRLPIRLPLTRPDLPFRRCPIDSRGLPERCTKKCSVMIVCLEQIMLQLMRTRLGSRYLSNAKLSSSHKQSGQTTGLLQHRRNCVALYMVTMYTLPMSGLCQT